MLKVLVLVDGSENSNRAVRYVINSAELYKEPLEIHLLNVQPPIVSGNVKRYISHDDLNKYHHDEGVAALAEARKILDGAGIKYVYHISVGEIGETIVQYVDDKRPNHIVMGKRGLGP